MAKVNLCNACKEAKKEAGPADGALIKTLNNEISYFKIEEKRKPEMNERDLEAIRKETQEYDEVIHCTRCNVQICGVKKDIITVKI